MSVLLPESQCRERDARRRARHSLHSKKKKSASSLSDGGQVSPKSDVAACNTVCENPLELLRREERIVVEKLVAYQDQYEVPTEEAVSSLTRSTVVFCLSVSIAVSHLLLSHFCSTFFDWFID